MNGQNAGKYYIAEYCDNWGDRWEIKDKDWDFRWLALTAFYVTDRKDVAEKLRSLLEQRQRRRLRRRKERSTLLRTESILVDATTVEAKVEQNADRALAGYFYQAASKRKSRDGSVLCIRFLLKEEKRIRKIMRIPNRPARSEHLPDLSYGVQEQLWKYFYVIFESLKSGTDKLEMEFVGDVERLLKKSVSEATLSRYFNKLKNHGYVEFSRNKPVTLTTKGLTEFRQLLINEEIVKEMAELKAVIKPEDIDEALKQLALQVSENAKKIEFDQKIVRYFQ